MTSTHRVARSTTEILIANLAKNAALFIVLIIVSRQFGPDYLGTFSLALAIGTPFYAFALFGARVLRLTGPQTLSTRSIAEVLAITGFGALVVSIAVAFAIQILNSSSGNASTSLLIGAVSLIAVYKWSDLYTELYAGQLQRTQRTLALLVTSCVGAALIVAGVWTAASLTNSFVSLCVALAIAGAAFAALFALVTRDADGRSGEGVRTAFRLGLPLGLGGGVAVFSSSLPQYVVAGTIGTAAVGMLAVLLYVYALADLFGAAYGQAWVHRISSISNTRSKFVFSLRVGVLSSAALTPIAALGVWAYAALTPVIFGPAITMAFDEAVALTVSVALLPLAHLLLMALFVQIAYQQSLIIMSLSAFAVTAAALGLVPLIGVSGALWAVAIGVLVRIIASAVFMKRILKRG